MSTYGDIAGLLTQEERSRATRLVIVTIVCSLLETAGVALFYPFLSTVQDPVAMQARLLSHPATSFLGVWSPTTLTLAASVALLVFFLLKNIAVYYSIRQQSHFIYLTQAALATRLFRRYLTAPWAFHLRRNPSDLLRTLTHDVAILFGNVLLSYVTLCSEGLVAFLVLLLLLTVDPMTSTVAITLLGASAFLFYRQNRDRSSTFGREQQQARGEMIRWVNQGLGGTKEIRVLGREEHFVDNYRRSAERVGQASVHLNVISQAPRLFFETLLAGGLVVAVGLAVARGESGASLLPTLALIGAATFRLLPAANRVVSTIANIRYHRASVEATATDFRELARVTVTTGHAMPDKPRVPLSCAITVNDVSYQYEGMSTWAVNQVSFSLPKGAVVAIEGRSGAGKSTLLDVLLGLLPPASGRVCVDDKDIQPDIRAWQRSIGYIPQNIYLSDASIRANVAFGLPDEAIDDARVWRALDDACLSDVVRQLPEGLLAEVGERGIRLSGGQRQRLAIARALYHDPDLLVLDEATTALDDETESEVIAALDRFRGRKTMLVISHKPTTTAHCDFRILLENGRLVRAGSVEAAATPS